MLTFMFDETTMHYFALRQNIHGIAIALEGKNFFLLYWFEFFLYMSKKGERCGLFFCFLYAF